MTKRNELFKTLTARQGFTTTNLTKAIREFEAEGLLTITDISDGIHPFWRIERTFAA